MKLSKNVALAIVGSVGILACFFAGFLLTAPAAAPHDDGPEAMPGASGGGRGGVAQKLGVRVAPAPVALGGPRPLVYALENTGAQFHAPALPTLETAPVIQPFPDPFAWVNDPMGKTRSTDFKDWEKHRAEIMAMFEKYEIGAKPVVDLATQVTASWTPNPPNAPNPPAGFRGAGGPGGQLAITVKVKDQSLTMNCSVSIPPGAQAPYPILIAAGSSSLPAQAFSSRGIVTVNYNNNALSQDGRPTANDAFYRLYPDQKFSSSSTKGDTGQYAVWAWGVSRVIDGLTLVKDKFSVDLNHIAITGCSRNGKLALFAGALDERIALTIAQESGGGGAASWRYSAIEKPDAAGKLSVEGITNTDHAWFAAQMFSWGGDNLSRLPEDHHMLAALCAPRALYVTSNTDFTWLSNPSFYVNSKAVARVYETLGVADRFGYCVNGGYGHCAFPASQNEDLNYFLDKFILGQSNLSRVVATFPDDYAKIDADRWTKWWGTGKADLPPQP